MIHNFTDAKALLYHYTTADKAYRYILKNRTLKLSDFTSTNDPKETTAWDFKLTRYRANCDSLFLNLPAQFSNHLKSNAKIACFCTDSSPLTGDHTKDILRRGWARPRMWAQYARKHSGVCLVFNKKKLEQQIQQHFPDRLFFSAPVEYLNASPFNRNQIDEFTILADEYVELGQQKYSDEHIRRYWRQLFFQKLEDWRDECEWRLFVLSEAELFVPLGDSLVGVVHGAQTSSAMSDRIIGRTNSATITHCGLKWSRHAPWYDFGSPRWDYEARKTLTRIRRRATRVAAQT